MTCFLVSRSGWCGGHIAPATTCTHKHLLATWGSPFSSNSCWFTTKWRRGLGRTGVLTGNIWKIPVRRVVGGGVSDIICLDPLISISIYLSYHLSIYKTVYLLLLLTIICMSTSLCLFGWIHLPSIYPSIHPSIHFRDTPVRWRMPAAAGGDVSRTVMLAN